MTRIFFATTFLLLFSFSVASAADVGKMKKYIVNNIYYDCANPIFKAEDKLILDGFKASLMISKKTPDKNTIKSSLQKLYDSFDMEFSDSNEERRGYSITAIYFAELAILAKAEEPSNDSNRPQRLIDHAKYCLLASGESNFELLIQNYFALLALEYYLTNDFNYDEVQKYIPKLSKEKQEEFKKLFKKEIATSQKQ